MKGGFDVERILFGWSLEKQVAYVAEQVLVSRTRDDGSMARDVSVLESFGYYLADELARRFRDGDSTEVTEDARVLAMSFLYLFPKLWKAIDRPLSLDKLKALDFADLLSERRRPRHGRPNGLARSFDDFHELTGAWMDRFNEVWFKPGQALQNGKDADRYPDSLKWYDEAIESAREIEKSAKLGMELLQEGRRKAERCIARSQEQSARKKRKRGT